MRYDIMEFDFKRKIRPVAKNEIKDCIAEFLANTNDFVVITVIAKVDDVDAEEIWAEVELAENEVWKWIGEMSECCIIKFIHISMKNGSDQTWRLEE